LGLSGFEKKFLLFMISAALFCTAVIARYFLFS